MIRGFEPVKFLEPRDSRFQWGPALRAGLVAGVILLIVPHGSPWEGVSVFSFVIMGRPIPSGTGIPLPLACLIHLCLAELYSLFIARFIAHVNQAKAIFSGGLLGLVLYLINLAIVSFLLPRWRTNEISVLITHVVFGLIAGAAYRGLLRRRAAQTGPPGPG